MLFGIDSWIVWTILMVIFLIAEAMTLNMTTAWFAVGALVALIFRIVGLPVWLQITAFVIVSVALLLLFIFMIKPKIGSFMKKSEATNADRVIGIDGIVTTEIDPVNATGLVKVKGQVWSASSEDGRKIPEGKTVVVTEIRGVRVIVKPLEEGQA
ncbi:MAG: NfeD family protein [Oscillospiraceae bacterium]|nr:NfeD family protein [Oscillospiraceae bacterium]